VFGSAILEVAISLVFIYILLALFVSATNEFIASLFNWRATTLHQGLHALFNSADAGQNSPKDGQQQAESTETENKKLAAFVEELYRHPLIQGLGSRSPLGGEKRLPDYIPNKTFTAAMIDTLIIMSKYDRASAEHDLTGLLDAIEKNKELQPLINLLRPLAAEARETTFGVQNQIQALQDQLNTWFDNGMDYVTGVYRRHIQKVTFAVAATVVITLNIDTITFASAFLNNQTLREVVVSQADTFIQDNPNGIIEEADPDAEPLTTPEAYQQLRGIQSELDELGLPIGWVTDDDLNPRALPTTLMEIFQKMLGLLLTIGAVSLGAPFWFSVLNNLVNIRNSEPPEKEKTTPNIPPPVVQTIVDERITQVTED